MLERLDRVDWDQLSHAYGEASDVPDLLRALASEEAEARSHALDELYGNIWHQGTVYEATAHAVPFLLELLEEPAVQAKDRIVDFLRSLATGSSYLDVHKDLAFSPQQQGAADFERELTGELGFVKAAREAVLAGTATYLRLLSDGDVDIRTMAAFLLAALEERRGDIRPVLLERLGVEPDPQVKASQAMALLELSFAADQEPAGDPRADEVMEELMRSEQEPVAVRSVAAFFLVRSHDEAPYEAAQSVLRECLDPAREDLEALPWADDFELMSIMRQTS